MKRLALFCAIGLGWGLHGSECPELMSDLRKSGVLSTLDTCRNYKLIRIAGMSGFQNTAVADMIDCSLVTGFTSEAKARERFRGYCNSSGGGGGGNNGGGGAGYSTCQMGVEYLGEIYCCSDPYLTDRFVCDWAFELKYEE